MENKFSITFCITGNPQELKNIIPELVKIGHKDDPIYGSRYSMNDCRYLFVNYKDSDIFLNQHNEFKFTEVDVKNTKLVLALASMRTNKNFFVGEYIKDDLPGSYFKGVFEITKIINDRAFKIKDYPDALSMSYYRKATVEEIIQHFKDILEPVYIITGEEYIKLNKEPMLMQLPEKWCIKRTLETDEIITKWFNKNSGYSYHLSFKDNLEYPYMVKGENKSICSYNAVPPEYTEITFDDFKRLVLNEIPKQEQKMNKKLISYKLKDSCKQFEAVVKILLGFSTDSIMHFIQEGSQAYISLKNFQVLDLWFEPVYEDIKKDIQVKVDCNESLSFTISTRFEGFVRENVEYRLIPITSLAKLINFGLDLEGYTSYKIMPTAFNIGCIKNINISYIGKVVSEYDSFWGTSHYSTTI